MLNQEFKDYTVEKAQKQFLLYLKGENEMNEQVKKSMQYTVDRLEKKLARGNKHGKSMLY